MRLLCGDCYASAYTRAIGGTTELHTEYILHAHAFGRGLQSERESVAAGRRTKTIMTACR